MLATMPSLVVTQRQGRARGARPRGRERANVESEPKEEEPGQPCHSRPTPLRQLPQKGSLREPPEKTVKEAPQEN